MINWVAISESIFKTVHKSLKEGSPSFNDDEIIEAIELFNKFVKIKSGYALLDGLSKIILPALQDSLINKKGELDSLTLLSTSIEPYIRKLLILTDGVSFSEIEKLGLANLLKRTNINVSLSTQIKSTDYPQLTEAQLASYSSESEYLYSICHSYLLRNKIHISEDLEEYQILYALKHLLVLFIYLTFKYKDKIKQLPEINKKQNNEEKSKSNEEKMLYDFINFGNTSTEIKTQIVNAFILHTLTDNIELKIEELISKSDSYFQNSFSEQFYNRRIDNLIRNRKIEYSGTNKEKIKLTNEEKLNLEKKQINFNENRDLFLLYYDELVNKYNIQTHKEPLLSKLKDFFENNFNVDICEIYCNLDNNINNGNTIYSSIVDYLKTIALTETDVENILKDILLLCENNDFLIRICASKVFCKISNPDQFDNYLRLQNRKVYLDSQIILYALCCNYLSKDNYDNIFYKITSNLLKFTNSYANIELRFANQYISEISYQLKQALLLIPFVDNDNNNDLSISSNIYYQFFCFLKKNSLLEQDTEFFSEFMSNWFLLNEDDAYSSDYEKISSDTIISILTEEIHINVEKIPYYDTDSVSILLEDTIKKNLLPIKSPYVLKNDAIMLCHLFNSAEHISEPYFLTWDKSFTYFRKVYKERYRRQETISLHLFNPSKFMNHIDLINFKIVPSSITNDFISIMDGLGVHNMTKSIFDTMNKFLDIKNLPKAQRHKYIQITKDIFSESEFSYEIDSPKEDLKSKISDSFASTLENMIKYLHNESVHGIEKYRKMLLDENYFISTVELIQSSVKKQLAENVFDNKLYTQIDQILKEFETNYMGKIIDSHHVT